MTMKNSVLWDVTPCGSCKNRCFGGILRLHFRCDKNRRVFLCSVRRLLFTANIPCSLILVALMMEAIRFSETSVLTRVTRRNISEDGILHSLQYLQASYQILTREHQILHYNVPVSICARLIPLVATDNNHCIMRGPFVSKADLRTLLFKQQEKAKTPCCNDDHREGPFTPRGQVVADRVYHLHFACMQT
jgi:hypothetical protein